MARQAGSGPKHMGGPNRRQILTWLGGVGLTLLATFDDPAEAKSGKGKRGGKGRGGGGKGGGGSGSGRNNGNAKGKGADKPSKDNAAGAALDHDAALKAVRDGRAQPLQALLPKIERKYGSEVIDAALRQAGRRLIYTLRMLSPKGRVFVIVVDAATGEPDDGAQLLGL